MKIRRSLAKSKVIEKGMREETHVQADIKRINIKKVSDRQPKTSTNGKWRSAIIVERKDTTSEIVNIRKLKVM